MVAVGTDAVITDRVGDALAVVAEVEPGRR